MLIDARSISMIVSVAITLPLAIFVYFRNPKRFVNQAWAAFSFAASCFVLGQFLIYSSPSPDFAVRWAWLIEIGINFCGPFFLLFVLAFIRQEYQHQWGRLYMLFALSIAIFVQVIERTSFVHQTAIKSGAGYFVQAFPIQHLTALTYLFNLPIGIWLLSVGYRRATSKQRINQYRYITFGLGIGFTIAMTDYLQAYGIGFPPIGHMGVAFAVVVFAYAIIKHQLMDIKVVIRKGLVYTSATLALTAIYFSGIFIFGLLFGRLTQAERLWAAVGWIFLFSILFEPIRRFLQNVIDRLFFKDIYNRERALAEFSDQVVATTDINQLLERTIDIVSSTLKAESALIMLVNRYLGRFEVRSFAGWKRNDLNGLSIGVSDPALGLLVQGKVLIRSTNGMSSETRALLDRYDIEVAAPILSKMSLVGLLCLGKKASGEFTETDLQIIDILLAQLAVAVETLGFRQSVTGARSPADAQYYFERRLETELIRAEKNNTHLSVVMIDVTGTESDQLVAFIESIIRRNIRSFDIAIHLFAGKYGLILPGAQQQELEALRLRIFEATNGIASVSMEPLAIR